MDSEIVKLSFYHVFRSLIFCSFYFQDEHLVMQYLGLDFPSFK